MHTDVIDTQHLIIGSGVAGLMLALKLAPHGKVLIIAKGQLDENATRYAQGGIASVLGAGDSFAQHVADTLTAGAGLCHAAVVKKVVEAGPAAIAELIDLGVGFTKTEAADQTFPYHLTREGGHSVRRVIHAEDITGHELLRALIARVRAHANINVKEHQFAVDLLTSDKYAPNFSANSCFGAYVMDRSSRQIYQIRSRKTYLCTGGHGKVYLYTSNPDSATGDGLAMAWRAGCKLANLEFMQFHPTCLFVPAAKNFLISEAVRGEGGVIKNAKGVPFVDHYHPMGSLAPRDIVARAIDLELKKSGDPCVFLDARALGDDVLKKRFPNIYATCAAYGIDIAREMIPVVPAAHYSCGGVIVDDHGRTGVDGLYAMGEVACTGLHGANRLASNSLLEAVVFAQLAAQSAVATNQQPTAAVSIPAWQKGRAVPPDEVVMLAHAWDEVRRLMWNYVGIVRSDKRLQRAYDRVTALRLEIDRYYWDYELTSELIEVRNLCQVAWLTVRSAMARKESRGIHYTIDYPEKNDELHKRDTIIW